MSKIAVLTSGHSRGSNLKAIAECLREQKTDAEVALVIVTCKQAPVIELCKDYGMPYKFISSIEMKRFEAILLEEIHHLKLNMLVLAGFMKQLSQEFLTQLEIPVLNIHPALLPKYGGKGMYGINVHRAVFEAGDKISGATIHLVNQDYDEGRILAQMETDISACQSPEEIAARVLKIEHQLYPQTILKLLEKI